MPVLLFVAFCLLPLAFCSADMIRLTLGFESDPLGAPPLGAKLSVQGCAWMTNAPVCSGQQSLAVVSTGQVARVEWGTYYPDLFSGWYEQAANVPINVRLAARAAQTNATLDLWLGQDPQQTAVRLQFKPGGALVAVTADGVKPLTSYVANAWYHFDITLWTNDPRYHVTVSNAKDTPLVCASNLVWFQPALTNSVLFGFAFSAQDGGALFVDDLRIQEVNPIEKRPWPRQLVTYPKSGGK